MKALLILTQATLLVYGSRFTEFSEKLDKMRFICYLLIILNGLFLLRGIKQRKLQFSDLLAGGLIAFAFLSSFYSTNPGLTLLRSTTNLLMYLAIFWSLWLACRGPADVIGFVRSFISVWILFYIANFVFLLVRPGDAFYVMGGEYYAGGEYLRFTGITPNPNGIGNFSAMILPLALWNLRQKKNLLSLFLLAAVLFSFFFSLSRDAFISGIIGGGVFIYLTTRKNRPLLILCSICLIVFMFSYVHLFGLFLPETLVRHQTLGILGGRLEAWEAALQLIRKRPLLGYGFGVEDLLFEYFGYRFKVHSGAYVHNSFLGLALQLGWVASSLLYLTFFIFLIRSFVKIAKFPGQCDPLTGALYGTVLSGFSTTFFESWIYATGGILAFTFFVCVMLLMRMGDFQKGVVQTTDVLDHGPASV